jgi:tripartite-type tricarboxylate transporter receptor subunit TctC
MAGLVRPLAISGEKRSPIFPDVPAIAEFYPGFSNGTWLALFAPKNTPEPILERIRTAVNKVLADPDTQARFSKVGGMQVYATDARQFQSRIKEDDEKYAAIIKRIGARID